MLSLVLCLRKFMAKSKGENRVQGKAAGKPGALKIIVVAVVVIAAALYFLKDIFTGGPAEVETTHYEFKKEGELTFLDSLGQKKIAVDLEVADTEYERMLGLMYRKSMEENQAMLFIFPDEEIRSFWMMNTYISLDMVFVDANKRIVTIHRNTKTLSQQSYQSTKPATYVIEVVAGFCDRHGIAVGDRVIWQ